MCFFRVWPFNMRPSAWSLTGHGRTCTPTCNSLLATPCSCFVLIPGVRPRPVARERGRAHWGARQATSVRRPDAHVGTAPRRRHRPLQHGFKRSHHCRCERESCRCWPCRSHRRSRVECACRCCGSHGTLAKEEQRLKS